MKRHLLLLVTLVYAGMWSLNAITLNNVAYTIDTLAQFSPGPGATYYQLRMLRAGDKLGRLDCWLMTVDTKNPYVSIEAVMGQNALVGTERPSAMAIRKTTDTKIFYGGTNGDFFITSGDVGLPRGLTVVNNEYVFTPTSSRRFGGVSEQMLGVIGTTAKFSGKLVLPDTTLTIKHVNYTRNENELVLYNQHNAATTGTNAYGTELLVELLPDYAWHTTATVKAKVLTKQVGVGSMPIPAGKAVLSGHGTMQTMLNTVSEGDTVTIKLTLKIDGVNTKMSQCIGGDNYALIVDSGRVEQSNFWDELHPRTAFGMSEAGDSLFFLVVDGRSASMGCTTKVLGEIINYYGAWRAVNYDGGGSSCLYLRHFGEVNNGSDGSERAVGNAIYAIANVPEADNTIVAIAPYNPTYSLPRYGLSSPKFLGYNRYGVLVETDVQGITLSCDPSVGEVMEDGRFLASGTQGGLLHASLNDSVACDIQIRLTVSAPVNVRLDSVLLDSKHPYEIEVSGKVGNATMQLLPSALTWQVQDEQVIAVSAEGVITGLNNGSTVLTGTLGEYADTMLVNVEIPETPVLSWERYGAGWTFSSTTGFDPQMSMLLGGTAAAKITFNYAIGRSPFLKMEKKARMYSLPDTIRWGYSTDALFSKVTVGIRPNNAQQARAIAFTPDQTQIAIPVRETFGDDAAIFPLWLEYINFSVDTKTTTGSHEILLNPIELVYSEYTESALQDVSAEVGACKVLQNGQLYILRDGVRYTVLGQNIQ
ncbi:MAG: phosphodiester glycosidase family protein [Paludibacteraceae bacterium]|nr:phosphodiester glycosidase family protein [Paludibacteraceae bacterium]